MKKQSLEEQFEEKFRNYRLQPNAQVWQTIETELQQSRATHRKALPVWWAVAASGALVLSAYTGYQYYNSNHVTQSNVATIPSTNSSLNTSELPQKPSTTIESVKTSTASSQNVKIEGRNKALQIAKKPEELPMQQIIPIVPQHEVVIKKNEPSNDVNNPIKNASIVPKTGLAEVKTLPSPPTQTINTLPNNPNTTITLPDPNASQPNTITYEPTVKQPILSAWRELSENSPQDSTTSERLLQLAENKAKRLVKRVDIAGIWSDFKTLRGR